MAERKTCLGTKRDGTRCGSTALLPTGYCTAHSPGYREKRRADSARGGRRKANRERMSRNMPADMRTLAEDLTEVFRLVREGQLESKVGSALASIAGAIVKVHEVGVLTAKLEDIERRLRESEQASKANR